MAVTTAQHTPGPWEIGRYGVVGWEISGTGRSVAIVNRCQEHARRALAEKKDRIPFVDRTPCGQSEADARLIAAAPALLEAAQQATAALLERKLVWDAGRSQGPLVSEGEALHVLADAIAAAVAS